MIQKIGIMQATATFIPERPPYTGAFDDFVKGYLRDILRACADEAVQEHLQELEARGLRFMEVDEELKNKYGENGATYEQRIRMEMQVQHNNTMLRERLLGLCGWHIRLDGGLTDQDRRDIIPNKLVIDAKIPYYDPDVSGARDELSPVFESNTGAYRAFVDFVRAMANMMFPDMACYCLLTSRYQQDLLILADLVPEEMLEAEAGEPGTGKPDGGGPDTGGRYMTHDYEYGW